MSKTKKVTMPLWRLMGVNESAVPKNGLMEIEQEPEETYVPNNWLAFDVRQEVAITLDLRRVQK